MRNRRYGILQETLLFLAYNRGSGLGRAERRKEMRNIQKHLQNKDYHKIPNMKRLWSVDIAKGLLRRRDKEAEYFTKGLQCKCN